MIITVASTKGGVGKSTIAVNIAVAMAASGHTVIVDTDRQGSAGKWSRERTALPAVPVMSVHEGVEKTVRKLNEQYDHVIVDSGGYDSLAMREALVVADVALIPTKATQSDAWELGDSMALKVLEAKKANHALRPIVVVNASPTHYRDTDAQEIIAAIKRGGVFSVAGHAIADRKSWRTTLGTGTAVTELHDAKAKVEIGQLLWEIGHEPCKSAAA
jgi:chromosome partitioning protein